MTARGIQPVILAGGSGRRLWPLSRADCPKQLLPLIAGAGAPTLIQETVQRVTGPEYAAPLVVTAEAQRFLVAEQVRTMSPEARVILEPAARNTAPAVAAAAVLAAREAPETLLLVLPADHHIARTEAFAAAVADGTAAARAGHLVTFGLPPTRPDTGFGYIRPAAMVPASPNTYYVERFIEKPARDEAEALLGGGDALWNSGMVLARADRVLAELDRHAPAVARGARAAAAGMREDLDFLRLDPAPFAAIPAISFDHAVLERTDAAAVVAADMGWSDIGTWGALWEATPQDGTGTCRIGDVISRDVTGSYLRSDGPVVAAVGVTDLVVVATGDAVLVVPRARAQEAADLATDLEGEGREEALRTPAAYRPWGRYRAVARGDGHQVKQIEVCPGAALSLQRHRHRAEHWVVVAGRARVTCGDRRFDLTAGESTFIPAGTVHRLENPGPDPLRVIEVQTGAYLGEDDIERFDPPPGTGDGSV